MMKTQIIYLFILLLSFAACHQEPGETEPDTTPDENQVTADDSLPDLSVFHLPGTWRTQDSVSIKLSALQGKVTIMVMIYTSCPYACPRLVSDMKQIEEQLPEDKLSDTQFVLVSIDPEADTPTQLKKFATEHQLNEQHWMLLQGTPSTVLELAAVLGVKYKKTTPVDFSHSNIISVFNRIGELVHQAEGLGVDHSKTVQVLNELL